MDAQEQAALVVYEELHRLASGYLGRERTDHTLQPTALVNEAYLRLLGQNAQWQNRGHFFAIAAQTMRRILVDHARRSSAGRRDRKVTVPLGDSPDAILAVTDAVNTVDRAQDVIDIHNALTELEKLDPRQARVVELRFFVGLTTDDIADVLGVSPATVNREWSFARRWLQHRLHPG